MAGRCCGGCVGSGSGGGGGGGVVWARGRCGGGSLSQSGEGGTQPLRYRLLAIAPGVKNNILPVFILRCFTLFNLKYRVILRFQ